MNTYSLNQYWAFGLFLILFYPFGLFIIGLTFLVDDLNFIAQLVSTIFNLFYIIYFGFIIKVFYENNLLSKYILRNKIFISFFCLGLIYFICQNLQPNQITFDPTINDSPFDQWYYFASQTYYGFPDPIFRRMEVGNEIYGKNIIHYDAIAFNLTIFSFCNYLFIGVFVIYDRVKTIKW